MPYLTLSKDRLYYNLNYIWMSKFLALDISSGLYGTFNYNTVTTKRAVKLTRY